MSLAIHSAIFKINWVWEVGWWMEKEKAYSLSIVVYFTKNMIFVLYISFQNKMLLIEKTTSEPYTNIYGIPGAGA